MDSTKSSPVIGRRLWHITRAVYYMMDLHLLLKRSKMAGKAISKVLTFQFKDRYFCALSCRYSEPNISFYNPKGIEFSCSNTPKKKNRSRRRHHHHENLHKYDVKAIAKAFEVLSKDMPESTLGTSVSPAVVRQLRVSDSPFMGKDEVEVDARVDKQAEEFILRFYEQLRLQQFIAVTPESLHVC
ncbi:hypothetical protein J5N97_004767 [Dioscorea zingiberensis]|uniref:Uncharacterized protein n=1 Tax=Dioscorea zingiberensis TaxID=325984 RepID=A0A9D5D799_9LILI|nr:hypothetical protein J5N97_004767 [Dioscorea zingiberensis]